MLNSKAKQGFTLIEVVISLFIFTLVFMGALEIMKNSIELKEWNRTSKNNLDCLEGLKGIMISSMSNSDITGLLCSGRIYVAEENLDMDTIKGEDVKSIFTASKPEEGDYITVNILEGDVLTVEMELYQKTGRSENVFSAKFYKGSYRRY